MSEYPTHLIRRIRHKAFGAEERIVLFVLADRMQKATDVVWPSVETVASDCGMSERGVRYVIGWLMSVGVLVEVDDGRRTRSFRIDFDHLACLPDSVSSRSRKETDRHRVPPTMHPVHLDRHAVQDGLTGTPCTQGGTGEQGDRHPVHPRPAPGAPKGLREGTKKEPVKEPFFATVPARVEVPIGAPLVLDFGPTDPSTPATIPAPPVARPETSKVPDESLPVDGTNPPLKGTVKAGKKPVRKFTDEQLAARDTVYAFWKKTYLDELGIEPIVGNVEVGQMVQLLKKVQWNAATACALIKNAFTDVFFRERIKTIGNITANPSKYQTSAPASQKRPARMSTMQTEPDLDDGSLAEDFGL